MLGRGVERDSETACSHGLPAEMRLRGSTWEERGALSAVDTQGSGCSLGPVWDGLSEAVNVESGQPLRSPCGATSLGPGLQAHTHPVSSK